MRTVLVVDDDDDVREVTMISLEHFAGWTVISASGGLDGVRLAREHHPDAVLLDLMMPVVDGIATFEMLRADPSTADIPVVLLTAKARVGAQPWDDLPLAGVVSKPFSTTGLADEISRLLGWAA